MLPPAASGAPDAADATEIYSLPLIMRFF
jgi:hypothetical protein